MIPFPRRVSHILFLCSAALHSSCHSPPRPETETPFESGKRAAEKKDLDAAIAQFTLAVANATNYFFTAAYLERGTCHLSFAEATADAVKRERHLKAALEDFDAILERKDLLPEEAARALETRGKILLCKGQVPDAEECFEKILRLPLRKGALHYHVSAYRHLGWILLDRALAAKKENLNAEEAAIQERFRQAQQRFSSGLQIDRDDEECNLGKGICLYFREQSYDAAVFLEESTRLSEEKKDNNPRGHFYLACSYEFRLGIHEKALEHYKKAVAEDTAHTFTPLYAQLIELISKPSFPEEQFQWSIDSILSYAGNDAGYWNSVETLADNLAKNLSKDRAETGIFSRAVARARNNRIEAAVEDSLLLQNSTNSRWNDFPGILRRIFPLDTELPPYFYGQALALLKAKRREELEALFESDSFKAFERRASGDTNYEKTLLLEGRNILEAWVESHKAPIVNAAEKIERDKKLGRARDIFQRHLLSQPQDYETRIALAKVQELMDSFATAYVTYKMIANDLREKGQPDTDAFLGITRLHRDGLLTGEDLKDAWSLLRSYDGQDEGIRNHIRSTREALEANASLYCRGCGRKGMEGDTLCVECGYALGSTTPTALRKVDSGK